MLKFQIAKLEDVAEALRGYYKPNPSGDGFILNVEGGVVPSSKLEEFRDNNVALKRENQELKDKWKDADPAKYAELVKLEKDLKDGKIKGTDAERILNERTEAMKTEYEGKITAATKDRDSYKGRLENLLIVDSTMSEAMKLGLVPTAKDDLAARAKASFGLNDKGEPVVMKDGKEVFGAAGTAMGVKEWLAMQVTAAPHLFGKSSGSGSGGGGGGGGAVTKNPFEKQHWNLTEQSKLYVANRAEADRLKQEAAASGK